MKRKQTTATKSNLRKAHKGPKRHLFKQLKPMIHVLHQNGLLNKYNCEESFVLACQARNGKANIGHGEWLNFCKLKTVKEKDEYFASLIQSK